MLNTDKAPTYAGAIAELKARGQMSEGDKAQAGEVPQQRRRGRPFVQASSCSSARNRGFKTLKTAYPATIKGFEVMRALRKGAGSGLCPVRRASSARQGSVERAFGVGPCALSIRPIVWLQDGLASAET